MAHNIDESDISKKLNNTQNAGSLLEEIENIEQNTEKTLEEQMNKLGEGNTFSEIMNNLKTLGNEESLNNLFKDFTNSFQNTNGDNNNSNGTGNNNLNNEELNDEYGSENYDFESLNLDKYLLDDSGSNICSILSKINNQLQNINDNMSKLHDR